MVSSAKSILATAFILALGAVVGYSAFALDNPGARSTAGDREFVAGLKPSADPVSGIREEDSAVEESETPGAEVASFGDEPAATSAEGPAEGRGAPLVLAALQTRGHYPPDPAGAGRSTEAALWNGLPTLFLDNGDMNDPQPLTISGLTFVRAGKYYYGYVNIVNGGSLIFLDANIDFWAKSILVEDAGALIVGTPATPIGTLDPANVVTFYLYGTQDEPGIKCKTLKCGAGDAWDSDGRGKFQMPGFPVGLGMDNFYRYERLPADGPAGQIPGLDDDRYFGRKVIAVSYGGTIAMYGKKGATYQQTTKPSASLTSWARLARSVDKGDTEIQLDREVDWQVDDEIVVTTTDYLPGHSERLTIRKIESVPLSTGVKSKITLYDNDKIKYPHNGRKYNLSQHDGIERLGLNTKAVETRAAVGLLSRNVRIVSKGAGIGKDLPPEDSNSTERYFGGHTIARQGFQYFQMKGVEFHQMGQGGRMAHSPVNFFLTRQTPPYTMVADCSIHDSMTRFIELRGTAGVDVKRNVGYMSIGHGYTLEDATETHNNLTANLGVYARPAVQFVDNPRSVPGIASAGPLNDKDDWLTLAGDYVHPSVYFISNAYNDINGNMAVGAGACGACYWFAPAKAGPLTADQTWKGYAGIQKFNDGTAPIKSFKGNFCSTSPYSLITIGSPVVCDGVVDKSGKSDPDVFARIPNPFEDQNINYGASIKNAGVLKPVVCDEANEPITGCDPDCSKGNTKNCAVNVIDTYTSSFHWAQQGFSAIWLRTYWFLMTDSVLTDVLNGGLSMVSGGSYDQVVNKYWALTRKTVFIGHTQEDNEFASNAGPVNQLRSPGNLPSTLKCKDTTATNYCRLVYRAGPMKGMDTEGIAFPLINFSVYQRLYNIYDGPVYQDSNAFLNIKRREITGCDGKGGCPADDWLFAGTIGIPKGKDGEARGKCVFPNAAIGWKQPNGFYYPPAFHSTNLFFDDVDIRHFVIVPLFTPGTNKPDSAKVRTEYCTYPIGNPGALFSNDFTDIDRQTELNDDDGSLSGLKGAFPQQFPDDSQSTVSVNTDSFYYAPRQILECLSEETCIQSPYDFISAVVYPGAGAKGVDWDQQCTTRNCYGVPIYRQLLNRYRDDAKQTTVTEPLGESQSIRMMGAETFQRSTLIVNKGRYYIDTTRSARKQKDELTGVAEKDKKINAFNPGGVYNFFLIYAKETTKVTFQLYVGKGLTDKFLTDNVNMVRVGTNRHKNPVDTLDDATVLSYPLEFNRDAWPDPWTKDYNDDTGILTVTMNLRAFQDDFDKGKDESCGPQSFCTMYNHKCVDARGVVVPPISDKCSDYDKRFCDAFGKNEGCRWDESSQKCLPDVPKPADVCKNYSLDSCSDHPGCAWDGDGKVCAPSDEICKWSVKASECPSGGCLGFQVKFPDGSVFSADDDPKRHRPATWVVDADPRPGNRWSVEWDTAGADIVGKGGCLYPQPPADYIPPMQ